jgi:hypothetical protein
MGLTFRLGQVPLAIFTDSSNNVGIGGAANASFKLQVTGSVNLEGNVTTTGAQFVQNGFYLTNANGGSAAGYTNMWGATDGIFFGLRNGTGGGKFIFQSATSYDYTFPAATGTLALTSNLSAYLPLTGGTLTGALSGTSATFSGDVSVRSASTTYGALNVLSKGANLYNGISVFSNNGTESLIGLGCDGTSAGIDVTYGATGAYLPFIVKTGGTTRLTIASTGAATFSSSVTAGGDISYYNGANLNAIITSGAAANGRMYIYSSANADIGFQAGGSSWFTNNLGIGTNSPLVRLQVKTATDVNLGIQTGAIDATGVQINAFNDAGAANVPLQINGSTLYFSSGTSGTERMRITSEGYVGIGNSVSAVYPLVVKVGTNRNWAISNSGSGFASFRAGDDGYNNFNRGEIDAIPLLLNSQSGGNVGIGISNPSRKFVVVASTAGSVAEILNERNNSSGDFCFVTALGANANNTNSYHYIATTGGADKFYVYGNGTYTTVSDRRLKKNISKVTDTYLDKVLGLNIVNYNWNEQEDGHPLEFGMIAQEVEELIPSIVHEGREQEDGNIYKGIQSSILPYILIKAIQELNQTIQNQQQQINSLINR